MVIMTTIYLDSLSHVCSASGNKHSKATLGVRCLSEGYATPSSHTRAQTYCSCETLQRRAGEKVPGECEKRAVCVQAREVVLVAARVRHTFSLGLREAMNLPAGLRCALACPLPRMGTEIPAVM